MNKKQQIADAIKIAVNEAKKAEKYCYCYFVKSSKDGAIRHAELRIKNPDGTLSSRGYKISKMKDNVDISDLFTDVTTMICNRLWLYDTSSKELVLNKNNVNHLYEIYCMDRTAKNEWKIKLNSKSIVFFHNKKSYFTIKKSLKDDKYVATKASIAKAHEIFVNKINEVYMATEKDYNHCLKVIGKICDVFLI